MDQYNPDLVGMQEATPRWIDHIYEDYVDEYEIRYKYRAKNSQESTPLMLKKDKFELLDKDYFCVPIHGSRIYCLGRQSLPYLQLGKA